MKWKILMYTIGEWTPDLLHETLKVSVVGIRREESVKAAMEKYGWKAEEILLLAATDDRIYEANQLKIAVAGYMNPQFPGQDYPGVEMLIEGFDEINELFFERVYQRSHHLPWVIARTKRCIIREFCMEDLDSLYELYRQPGITYRIDEHGKRVAGFIEPLYDPEEEKHFQQAYIDHMYRYFGYGMWLVLDKKSGRLIGRAGIEHREYPQGVEPELGYLIHPLWQKKGIATEVCLAILQYAGDTLGFEKIHALTAEENTASIGLLDKLGFNYLEVTDISGEPMRHYIKIFEGIE